jgi:GH24 family phage-related lysozyme (muramidase)
MGIFKDFATSGYGDFTIGALDGITAAGERDARRNAIFAQDSLNKENKAFAETELAFKNKKEITNIIANNPFAFGITATADLNVNQIADRLTNRIFNEQRSIFENNDFNKVKAGVAKYLTRPDTLGQGIELSSPYVPSEDLFKVEQEKHSNKLSAISKTPRVDKLLMNVQRAEENVVSPEALTDSLTKVAGITAKGYGILNTFPNTELGNTNLKFMQTNIIVANAKAQFPNDAAKRSQFIEKKLFDNNINPLDAINFQSPVTYKSITKVLDAQGNALASKIAENTNAMAAAETDEQRVQIQNQTNQLIMQQYALINTYSGSAGFALAGKDVDKVGVTQQQVVPPTEEKPEEEEREIRQNVRDFSPLFKREAKPKRPLKEVLPDIRMGEPEDTGLDAFQASAVDQTPVVRQATAVTETQTGLADINDFTSKIKKEEGKPFLKAEKLFDEKNFTIGYGRNNANVKEGDTITQEQAEKFLAEDIEVRLKEIQRLIPRFATFPKELQLALFSEYYRGSIRQSPKTVKLINQGRYQEAAGEFLDNEEYRTAEEKGKSGIIGRMQEVFDELNKFGLKTTKSS